jgi:hypothetical protein
MKSAAYWLSLWRFSYIDLANVVMLSTFIAHHNTLWGIAASFAMSGISFTVEMWSGSNFDRRSK